MFYDTTLLVVDPEENLIITSEKKKARDPLPPFTMIGREDVMIAKGFPTLQLLLDLDKAEQWFISKLLLNFNYRTNIAHFSNAGLNPTEIKRKAKAFKSLYAKNFIKRTKNSEFLFNPSALISPNHYLDVKKHWDSLP